MSRDGRPLRSAAAERGPRGHLDLVLVVLVVGQDAGGEVAVDLFLPCDAFGEGTILLEGHGDRAVGGERAPVAGRGGLPRCSARSLT
ncbi:hypothetical protein [Streptomyces atratus]|uniref:hypothetical protein n=1 Tax=Streptomyces atratus TaxID=1893 RepID=UPI00365C1A60